MNMLGLFVLAAIVALAVGPPVLATGDNQWFNGFVGDGATYIVLGLIATFVLAVIFGVATGKFYAGDRLGSWRSRQMLTVKSKMFFMMAMLAGISARLRDMFAGPFTSARRFHDLKLGAAA
jgi:hypothetical protein